MPHITLSEEQFKFPVWFEARPTGHTLMCEAFRKAKAYLQTFLDAHPNFRLDPFPHPLRDAETDGTLLIWPHEADTDAMFVARMVRTA